MFSTWKYQNKNQIVYFRGFVRIYRGNRYAEIACDEVRRKRSEALQDAKKLNENLSVARSILRID